MGDARTLPRAAEVDKRIGNLPVRPRKKEDPAAVRSRVAAMKERRADWHRVDTKVREDWQAALLYALAKDMRDGKPLDLAATAADVLDHDQVADTGAGLDSTRLQLLQRFAEILRRTRPRDLDRVARKLDVIEIITAPPVELPRL